PSAAGIGLSVAFARDSDGYFTASLERLESTGVAVATEDVELGIGPGPSERFVDRLRTDVRLQATNADSAMDTFIGIGPTEDVTRYLAGSAYDVVIAMDGDRAQTTVRRGDGPVAPPTSQSFWVAAASGPGSQSITWRVTSGHWMAVAMNSDGTPGVAVDLVAGVHPGILGRLALTLVAAGIAAAGIAAAAIFTGSAGNADVPVLRPGEPLAPAAGQRVAALPVQLTARLDEPLSRWRWLVKWLLAVPHVIVLLFLWVAFAVLTVVAWFAIVVTGRYPRPLFAFNVGVLRWTWRVQYFASTGGLGTDRYPPFSLGPEPDYPAQLSIDEPQRLSRKLVLVKSWLLAIPHYLVLAAFTGGTIRWGRVDGTSAIELSSGGLLGILVVIAAVSLVWRGRYPQPLFALIIGINRWIYRVIAYVALLTDQYPPFRLDQGGAEPAGPASTPPNGAPAETRRASLSSS
ncbi:MAG: DUF4389 domain-containing protein, partial [Acidimicrobiia bacterium]